MRRLLRLGRRLLQARRTPSHTPAPRPAPPAPSAPVHAQQPAPPRIERVPSWRADAEALSAELRALQGRPVVLHHWASWCASCVEELEGLARLRQRLEGGDLAWLGISWEGAMWPDDPHAEQLARAEAALDACGVTWPSALWTEAPEALGALRALGVLSIPQIEVLGRDGARVARFEGELGREGWASLEAKLREVAL